MMLGKRFQIFIVALFVVFSGLSTYCYGDCLDCWGEAGCPYSAPPCIMVTFSGVNNCPNQSGAPDGDYTLREWDPTEPNDCKYWYGNDDDFHIRYWALGFGDSILLRAWYWGVQNHRYFEGKGAACATSSLTNDQDANDCNDPVGEIWGYGGTATITLVWDCSACDNCQTLDINVSDYDDTLLYGRPDCCPPAEKGEDTTVTFTCSGAEYVIPVYKIEIPDPNDPNSSDWIEVDDSNLVDVNSVPAECSAGSSVSFDIQALKGRPPARAKVTVTGAFFTEGGQTNAKTRTVSIEPDMPDCCEDGCGGLGGGPGGGCPGGTCSVGPFGFGSGPPPPGTSCPILLGSL